MNNPFMPGIEGHSSGRLCEFQPVSSFGAKEKRHDATVPRDTPVTALLVWTRSVDAQQGSTNALTAAEAKAGWTLLFDGRTLSGLLPNGEADWRVEEGTITATKGTGFLVTAKWYGNFELKADFWADKAVNSGIFVRCGEGNPGA